CRLRVGEADLYRFAIEFAGGKCRFIHKPVWLTHWTKWTGGTPGSGAAVRGVRRTLCVHSVGIRGCPIHHHSCKDGCEGKKSVRVTASTCTADGSLSPCGRGVG